MSRATFLTRRLSARSSVFWSKKYILCHTAHKWGYDNCFESDGPAARVGVYEGVRRVKNPANVKYVKAGITGVAVAAICLVMAYVIFNMSHVVAVTGSIGRILTPFVYGFVIAYLLAPLCNRFERIFTFRRRRRGLPPAGPFVAGFSIALSVIIALAAIVALIIIVMPQVTSSALVVINTLPSKVQTFTALLHDALEQWGAIQEYWDSVAQFLTDQVQSFYSGDIFATMETVISGVGNHVFDAISVVTNLFFGILISIYMLASRRRFAAQAKLILYSVAPRKWAEVVENEVHFADKMFNGFLVGKIIDSLIIAVLCFVGCLLLKIENAAFISVIVFVLNIVPFFGPIIAGVFCGLLLLLQSPVHCLYFETYFIILQQFDGNILGPKIIGNTTGLSGFWVLFSILLFGGLWGVAGMVVGIPLFAVIYDIVRRLVDWGLRRRGQDGLFQEYRARFPENSPSALDFNEDDLKESEPAA